MTSVEQGKRFFKQYLHARRATPWVAMYAEDRAKAVLQGMGGIESAWRTDYPTTTYYSPQRIAGVQVDLSTPEKVRTFYVDR